MGWSELRAEALVIMALAWPVVLTNLNWTLMHLADVIIVGAAGPRELTVLAAARVVSFVVLIMGMGGMSAVLVFVSRADGAKDVPLIGHLFRQAVLLGLFGGLISLVFLMAMGGTVLKLAGIAPSLVAPGTDVIHAMAIGFPGQALLIAGSYFLEGVSRPRKVMLVNVTMLPVNALLAWAMVGGHFGFPAMGAVGAALATSFVSLAGGAWMIAMAWSLDGPMRPEIRRLAPARWLSALRDMPKLVTFGIVPALGAAIELVGFSWLTVLSTRLGDVTGAAFQTVISLHNIGFALALGLGSAAGVRVGNAIGAKIPEMVLRRTLIAAALSLLVMSIPVTAYLFAPDAIVTVFASDAGVQAQAALMLFLLAPFILLDGLQAIFMYALRSLGDQVAAGINGIIGFFLVMAATGQYFYMTGHGAAGLAYAAGAGMLATALLQGGRLWLVTRKL